MLRAPEKTDVDRIFLWENEPSFFESLPQAAPLSRLQVWEYIENYKADPFATRELRLMFDDQESGQTVGYVDLFDFDPVNRRAGVGIYIDDEYRQKGFGTQALAQIETYAANTLAIHQLWAIVAIDNQPSLALFAKCGFKPAGRLRSWIRRRMQYADALFLQKLFP